MLSPLHFCLLLFTKKHSGKGSAAGWMAGEWVDGRLVHEAVIGRGNSWTPHDERADWVKKCVNRDIAVVGSQCVLILVKFQLSFVQV